jgi:hypothetical protein
MTFIVFVARFQTKVKINDNNKVYNQYKTLFYRFWLSSLAIHDLAEELFAIDFVFNHKLANRYQLEDVLGAGK